jgi:cobalt-zinc-cadmium efflux system membrane fusion protein
VKVAEDRVGVLDFAGGLAPRRQLVILGVGALVALFLLFGLPKLIGLFAAKPPPAPPAPPPGTFVATDAQWATLKFAPVSTSSFLLQAETDGKIATNDDHTTQVFSPFSGRVTQVLVKAGEAVRAGQPLFVVQASEYAQAQADIATAAAQVRLTQAAETRMHSLYDASGAALKDWQQSQADLATAKANLEAVRNRLRILGQTDAQIAALEHNSGGIAQAVVVSPISGTVTLRAVGVGQNVGSVTNGGANPAFIVSDLSTVWLVGQLREADAPMAHVGEAVEVRSPDFPGQVFNAKVDYVAPTVDPTTHRVMVRATIPNPGGTLKPEMFASFTLIAGGATQSIGVPEDAVIFEGDTARVWVAHPGHTLELRQIKAGRTVDGVVEAQSGLQPGDTVVTSGSLFIDRAAQGD